MKKSSLVLAIILVAASIIFTAHNTYAWYSFGKVGDKPIHSALAMLSLDKVMQSDEFKSLNLGQKRDVLFYGANLPDRNKKLDHEATFRIENTLCASVKERKNIDALKRLAIGFHYLGDNGDATEGSYKKELLEIAYKMLFEEDDTYNDSLWSELKIYYDQEISQIDNVEGLVNMLRDMAKNRGRRLRNAYRKKNYDLVREEFIQIFAFIGACQNRLIDFYKEELINGETGQCCHGKNGQFKYCKGNAEEERKCKRYEWQKKVTAVPAEDKKTRAEVMKAQRGRVDGWTNGPPPNWTNIMFKCPPGSGWYGSTAAQDIKAGRWPNCVKTETVRVCVEWY